MEVAISNQVSCVLCRIYLDEFVTHPSSSPKGLYYSIKDAISNLAKQTSHKKANDFDVAPFAWKRDEMYMTKIRNYGFSYYINEDIISIEEVCMGDRIIYEKHIIKDIVVYINEKNIKTSIMKDLKQFILESTPLSQRESNRNFKDPLIKNKETRKERAAQKSSDYIQSTANEMLEIIKQITNINGLEMCEPYIDDSNKKEEGCVFVGIELKPKMSKSVKNGLVNLAEKYKDLFKITNVQWDGDYFDLIIDNNKEKNDKRKKVLQNFIEKL